MRCSSQSTLVTFDILVTHIFLSFFVFHTQELFPQAIQVQSLFEIQVQVHLC